MRQRPTITALHCEIGDHDVRSAIYRPKPDDKFGCGPCWTKELGQAPKWLGEGR